MGLLVLLRPLLENGCDERSLYTLPMFLDYLDEKHVFCNQATGALLAKVPIELPRAAGYLRPMLDYYFDTRCVRNPSHRGRRARAWSRRLRLERQLPRSAGERRRPRPSTPRSMADHVDSTLHLERFSHSAIRRDQEAVLEPRATFEYGIGIPSTVK